MSLGLFTDPAYDAGLDELADLQREKAKCFAREMRVLARLAVQTSRAGWQAEAPRDSLLLDVAGTCRVGQLSASSRLDEAEHLVFRLPATLAALEAGVLFVPQARVIVAETASCSPAVCAAVETRVLGIAAGFAPGPLKKRVRAAVLAVDAEQSARKAATARAERRVWLRPVEDGMALVCALAPAEQAGALMRRLTARAREARAAGDERTLDQLRVDLLCGGEGDASPGPTGTRRRRELQAILHVPVATGLGISDEPGELEGHGPLSAADTRRLLAEAELRKACVDSLTGKVLAVDDRVVRPAAGDAVALRDAVIDLVLTETVVTDEPEPQHDPSQPLARFVRLRDRGCDGIGCSTPASRCELDHAEPWPAGPTSAGNLRARSQRCHHAKHSGWSVVEEPDGSTRWTSPGGRRYRVPSRDRPPPVIAPGARLPAPEEVRARDADLTGTDPPDRPVLHLPPEPDW